MCDLIMAHICYHQKKKIIIQSQISNIPFVYEHHFKSCLQVLSVQTISSQRKNLFGQRWVAYLSIKISYRKLSKQENRMFQMNSCFRWRLSFYEISVLKKEITWDIWHENGHIFILQKSLPIYTIYFLGVLEWFFISFSWFQNSTQLIKLFLNRLLWFPSSFLSNSPGLPTPSSYPVLGRAGQT